MKRRARQRSAIHGRLRQVLAELVALVERLEFLGLPSPSERAQSVETGSLDAPKAMGKPTSKFVGGSPESNQRSEVPSFGVRGAELPVLVGGSKFRGRAGDKPRKELATQPLEQPCVVSTVPPASTAEVGSEFGTSCGKAFSDQPSMTASAGEPPKRAQSGPLAAKVRDFFRSHPGRTCRAEDVWAALSGTALRKSVHTVILKMNENADTIQRVSPGLYRLIDDSMASAPSQSRKSSVRAKDKKRLMRMP